MKFLFGYATASLLGFAVLGACGAPEVAPAVPTAPAASARVSAAIPAIAPTVTGTATGTPQPSAAERAAKLETQHAEYIKSCQTAVPDATAADALAFCECGWGELRAKASEAEILNDSVPKELADAVNQSSLQSCGPKMTEPSLKAIFMGDCMKDGAEMKPFCDCGFGVMIKEKLASLATYSDPNQMRAASAKIGAVCHASYPEKVLRDQILKGCTGGALKCNCIANAILRIVPRAKLIASDTEALKAARPAIAKCK